MGETDRRVRRTRRILHEALIALILEKGYDRITVQDVLDRADIGRSTFYAHYRDKEDLLVSSFHGVRADLRRQVDALEDKVIPDPYTCATMVLYEHAYANRRVYRALCGRHGGNIVYRHLHGMLGDLLRTHLSPHMAESDLPLDVVAEFATTAALGLLLWWVNQDFPFGPGELAAMFQRLAAPGIAAAVGQALIS